MTSTAGRGCDERRSALHSHPSMKGRGISVSPNVLGIALLNNLDACAT
jgi:hypothetical protein